MLTKNDLSQIRTVVKDEIKDVKKDLKKIDGKLDTTISFFDTSLVNQGKRLDRIDAVLQLPKIDLTS